MYSFVINITLLEDGGNQPPPHQKIEKMQSLRKGSLTTGGSSHGGNASALCGGTPWKSGQITLLEQET